MARPSTKKTTTKKKAKKNVTRGIVHVQSTFNNTIITISDVVGNVISWSSAGNNSFKGSRKSTPYAAQLAAKKAGMVAKEHGMLVMEARLKGAGSGREPALRELHALGFTITAIHDVTPIPHNGCRPPKRRRV